MVITVTMMGLAVSFATSNDATISLSLWPFAHRLTLPIWLFGTGAFVFGGILGAMLMGGHELAIRAKLWHAQSQIKILKRQTAQGTQKDDKPTLPQTLET